MTHKNETTFWIKRKDNEKFSHTKPEEDFKRFCDSKGYRVEWGVAIWVEGWRLRPDFDMKVANNEFVILIDGRYHWTDIQAKKDRWRDELYQKAGKKVIHIDAGLTEERYWKYLADYFLEAITRAEPVRYIRE